MEIITAPSGDISISFYRDESNHLGKWWKLWFENPQRPRPYDCVSVGARGLTSDAELKDSALAAIDKLRDDLLTLRKQVEEAVK